MACQAHQHCGTTIVLKDEGVAQASDDVQGFADRFRAGRPSQLMRSPHSRSQIAVVCPLIAPWCLWYKNACLFEHPGCKFGSRKCGDGARSKSIGAEYVAPQARWRVRCAGGACDRCEIWSRWLSVGQDEMRVKAWRAASTSRPLVNVVGIPTRPAISHLKLHASYLTKRAL
jgi:hypothetical protein